MELIVMRVVLENRFHYYGTDCAESFPGTIHSSNIGLIVMRVVPENRFHYYGTDCAESFSGTIHSSNIGLIVTRVFPEHFIQVIWDLL